MTDQQRAKLVKGFVEILQMREDGWEAFSEVAQKQGMKPYFALARLLVQMAEGFIERDMNKNSKKPRNHDG